MNLKALHRMNWLTWLSLDSQTLSFDGSFDQCYNETLSTFQWEGDLGSLKGQLYRHNV